MIRGDLFGNLCYNVYCIEKAYIVLLIIPIFFVLLFFIYKNLIKFRNDAEKKRFKKRKKWLRFFVLITRTLVILMMLFSMALPFTTEETVTHGDEIINLLVDSTDSMGVFDAGLLEEVKEKLQGDMALDMSQISSGKRSELGEGILRKMQGNDNLLLLTDGNNHFGKSLLDVGLYSRISDTRLFAVDIEPRENDAYVEIFGPGETIADTPNRFRVKVSYIGGQPEFTLQIYIDDKLEFSGKNIFEKEILKTFGEGYHKIMAKIIVVDFFEQNNIFYKTVKAVPKPTIVFVSGKSSLMKDGLKDIYELKSFSSLPNDLSKYSAVVIDDIPYSSLKSRIDDLTGFLLDGNGLVFIGGRKSFDKGGYKETLIESMLPVKMGTGKIIEPLKHNIVIALDISGSFGDFSFKSSSEHSTLDLGKGMVVKMIEGFRDDISVGLVAFTELGKIISEPIELKDNRPGLIQNIKTLYGLKGAGTSIEQGLFMAELALEKVKGTKNVILISDGKEPGRIGENPATIRRVRRMAEKGIKIFTVGLPSLEKGRKSIDKESMSRIAALGNGNYFEPTEYQFLNVFFGKPEEKEKIFSGSSNLAVMDKEHFITKDLDLNARITGVNFVIPKLGARSLIFTGDGNPVLNSWNFGLGRVITLATDDGGQWAGDLLKKENSMLITRIINYAVGNPEKDKELSIDAKDSYLGEESEIFVRSEKYPISQKLTFTKQGENIYKASFTPDKEGFYQFFDSIVAINPPREYYDLGVDPELKDMVEISGGRILKIDDNDVIEQIKSLSERVEMKRKDLKLYPLGIALVIFIIELIIRKMYEHKKYKG
ncbi:MAG: VWA domain-containing protein [Nanoarchaeota archaeon]|nr:VWA domain-containing protein [Nanoarchaeota archaeon]